MLALSNLRPETRAALAALRMTLPLVRERRGAAEIREKAPNDIVTGTDVLVQSTLQQALHAQHPDIAFLGEEGTSDGSSDAPRTWLVDPICGTSNYAAGLPLFATNVALVEEDRITASAIADGATGELYAAEQGRGAWQVKDADLVPIKVTPANRLVSIDPDNRGRPGLADFPTLFAIEALERRRWDVRAVSTTVALVWVATGRLGGAVFAPLGDALHFAAGVLLAREAGATATDQRGADWTLDSPILVVAAAPELHAELQSLANEVFERIST